MIIITYLFFVFFLVLLKLLLIYLAAIMTPLESAKGAVASLTISRDSYLFMLTQLLFQFCPLDNLSKVNYFAPYMRIFCCFPLLIFFLMLVQIIMNQQHSIFKLWHPKMCLKLAFEGQLTLIDGSSNHITANLNGK